MFDVDSSRIERKEKNSNVAERSALEMNMVKIDGSKDVLYIAGRSERAGMQSTSEITNYKCFANSQIGNELINSVHGMLL